MQRIMKPFLYFNNWHTDQPDTRFEVALRESGITVQTYRTQRGEFPDKASLANASGAYVSASVAGAYDPEPWIGELSTNLRALAAHQVPMLGLCFGAQVLAWALLGSDQVFKRADRETGYVPITLTPEGLSDPLTAHLPETLRAFVWHGDEVRADHPDLMVLARGDACANHVWRWKHGPVWGIQPHPEMDRTQIVRFIEQNRDWFAAEGKDADALIAVAEDNDQLSPVLTRFLAMCR